MATAITLPFSDAIGGGSCSTPTVALGNITIGELAYDLLVERDDYPFLPQKEWENQTRTQIADSLGSLTDSPQAEYRFYLTVTRRVNLFHFSARLLDMELGAKVVYPNLDFSTPDFYSGLSKVISEFADPISIITAHEQTYPTPPRDPTLKVTFSPKKVMPKEGKDKSDLEMVLKHCNGVPAYHKGYPQDVHLQKETKRGRIKAPFTTYTETRPGGTAPGVSYSLDRSKGTGRGTDTIRIRTRARGFKNSVTERELEIESWEGSIEINREATFRGPGTNIQWRVSGEVPWTVDLDKDPPELEGEGTVQVRGEGSAHACKAVANGVARVEVGGFLTLREEQPPLVRVWWHEQPDAPFTLYCPSGVGTLGNVLPGVSSGVEKWKSGGMEFVGEEGHEIQVPVPFSGMGLSGVSVYTLHLKENGE